MCRHRVNAVLGLRSYDAMQTLLKTAKNVTEAKFELAFIQYRHNLKTRCGASPEKVGWKRDRIDGQKVYLTIFTSFLLRNEYRPQESGVDMSTPVHPVAPPLLKTIKNSTVTYLVQSSIELDAK